MPVELSSRGFASNLLCKAYRTLGIMRANMRRAIKTKVEVAERASLWTTG